MEQKRPLKYVNKKNIWMYVNLVLDILKVCKLFPQIRRHIDYVEIGTPVSNKHYLAQPHGEIYGLVTHFPLNPL